MPCGRGSAESSLADDAWSRNRFHIRDERGISYVLEREELSAKFLRLFKLKFFACCLHIFRKRLKQPFFLSVQEKFEPPDVFHIFHARDCAHAGTRAKPDLIIKAGPR